MKTPTLWAAALLLLLIAPSCKSFTQGVTHAATEGAQILEVVAQTGVEQERLRGELERGEISQEIYLEQSRALSEASATATVARGKALFAELAEIAKSVKTEGVGNLPAAAGAFVGGVTQGQDTISAAMAALYALLGVGVPVAGTVAYGRSQTRREERIEERAKERTMQEVQTALVDLENRRNAKYLVHPAAPVPAAGS